MDKIAAILQIPQPTSLVRANKFIGALSWYRKFIPNFATLAAPIHAATNLTKTNRHKFRWKFAQSKAFKDLKALLINQPLFLHFPVDEKPLILTTDASGIGIGSVLQQEIDGQLYNLYYHSQLMTACERKYSIIEKEALAIYKCFVRMRPMLLGRSIIIMTDYCPLCHITEKTVKNARVDRITHLIQDYNIDQVIHIKGHENCLPDYLSRYSFDKEDELNDIEYGLGSKLTSLSSTHLSNIEVSNESLSTDKKPSNILATMVLQSHLHKPPILPANKTMNNKPESHTNSNNNIDGQRLPNYFFHTNIFD